MHRIQKVIVLLFLSLLSVGSFTYASGAKDLEPKRVLIIYTYHEGLPWERILDDSLRATLASKSSEPIELNVEHSDRVRYPDDAHLQNFIDLLRHKYSREVIQGASVGSSHRASATGARHRLPHRRGQL